MVAGFLSRPRVLTEAFSLSGDVCNEHVSVTAETRMLAGVVRRTGYTAPRERSAHAGRARRHPDRYRGRAGADYRGRRVRPTQRQLVNGRTQGLHFRASF